MRVAQIIGRCTLSVCHPSLRGSTWALGVPLAHDGLRNAAAGRNGDPAGRGEPLVLFDDRGATEGDLVALSEGAEAAAPFAPNVKPIDAYNAAILDRVDVE